MESSTLKIKDLLFNEGTSQYLSKIPPSGIFPAFFIYYASTMANEVSVNNDYINIGLNPRTMNILRANSMKNLPDIPTDFKETENDSQKAI